MIERWAELSVKSNTGPPVMGTRLKETINIIIDATIKGEKRNKEAISYPTVNV